MSNPELFWAIRGGGGSTFGVVVEATWKVYATPRVLGFHWYINSTLSTNSTDTANGIYPTSEAMEYLFSQLPDLHAKGIAAYFFVHGDNVRCHAIHQGELANVTDANAIWGPILEKMQSFNGMTPFQSKHFLFDTYKEFFNTTYGPDGTVGAPQSYGIVHYDSHLMAAEHLQSPDLMYSLRGTGGDYGILMTSPGMNVGDGSNTAANPGWRNATAFIIGMRSNTTNVDGLRELAPEMGTYINEV